MTVSLIIPARNAANFVEQAIEVARSQAPALSRMAGDLEILLVDNNSTDGTLHLLRRAAAEHDNVTVLECTTPGAPAARNLGLRHARGAWIQFLDADDTCDADKIARQLEQVSSATEWVIGGYQHRWPDGSTLDVPPATDPWKGLVYQYAIGCSHANLYRRETLLRIGGFDEALPVGQDVDLHFRLLRAGVPFLIDPPIRAHYLHYSGPRVSTRDPADRTQRQVMRQARVNAWLAAERPSYWRTNEAFFRGALLRRLRVLATYDLATATAGYHAFFGPDDGPQPAQFPLNGRYTRLYRLFGFGPTERLRIGLGKILPVSIKKTLKT